MASTRRRTRILRSSVSLFGVLLLTLNGEVRTVGRFLALTGDASVARSLSLEICTLFLRADKMLMCPLLYTPGVMVQTVSSGHGFDTPVVLATGTVLGQGCCLPVVFTTTETGTHSANCAEDADSTSQFLGKRPLFFNDRCRACFSQCLKQWRFRSCSTSKVVDVLAVAVHRQGMDVPAIMQRRSLAVGGATDSVHHMIWWTPSLHRDRLQLGGMQGLF